MVNSMDKVFTSIHKEGEKKANGIKGRELDGSIKHKPLNDDDNDDDDNDDDDNDDDDNDDDDDL